jgi:hypothetical protein
MILTCEVGVLVNPTPVKCLWCWLTISATVSTAAITAPTVSTASAATALSAGTIAAAHTRAAAPLLPLALTLSLPCEGVCADVPE